MLPEGSGLAYSGNYVARSSGQLTRPQDDRVGSDECQAVARDLFTRRGGLEEVLNTR